MRTRSLFVAAALAISGTVLAGEAPKATPTAAAPKVEWAGKYSYYHQEPNTDDGTTSFHLTVTKAKGGVYELVLADQGMANTAYQSKGTINAAGTLEARFAKDITGNLNPKAFKKGQLMFVLEASGDDVAVTWADDGKPVEKSRLVFSRNKDKD